MERRRTATLAQSRESQLTNHIVDSLERAKTELLVENDALVKGYDALQRQLEQLAAQYRKAAQLFLAKCVLVCWCNDCVVQRPRALTYPCAFMYL